MLSGKRVYSNIRNRLPIFFSSVAKLNNVLLLLSLAVNFNWSLHQFNVKNTFLHRELKEKIYMDIL
jgi:Reverse transcriptase (RNA-dependent DNA polymerase)